MLIRLGAAALIVAFAQPSEPLRIAVEDDASPWSRPDGTGFANDVVRAAFRAAGVEVRFEVVPYARCKEMVVSGRIAACFSMSRDATVDKAVRFPVLPLFICHAELVQLAGKPLPARRLGDLPRGTRIGTVHGYEYPEEVRRVRDAGSVLFEESPSEEILLRKLSLGRLQGAIININESKPIPFLLARAGVTSRIQVAGRVGDLASHIGFSARNAQGAWALGRYEAGMRAISANGVLRTLVRQWSDSSRAVVAQARGAAAGRQP